VFETSALMVRTASIWHGTFCQGPQLARECGGDQEAQKFARLFKGPHAAPISLPLGSCREQLAEILIELADRIRISAE
jgi:hypothetical protein